MTATLRRYVHLKRIMLIQGEKALSQFLRMNVQLSHRRDIYPLAWDLARQFNQPTAYDTAYLALAQLYRCDFWTADEKLYNAVNDRLPWVRWVGEVRLTDST